MMRMQDVLPGVCVGLLVALGGLSLRQERAETPADGTIAVHLVPGHRAVMELPSEVAEVRRTSGDVSFRRLDARMLEVWSRKTGASRRPEGRFRVRFEGPDSRELELPVYVTPDNVPVARIRLDAAGNLTYLYSPGADQRAKARGLRFDGCATGGWVRSCGWALVEQGSMPGPEVRMESEDAFAFRTSPDSLLAVAIAGRGEDTPLPMLATYQGEAKEGSFRILFRTPGKATPLRHGEG